MEKQGLFPWPKMSLDPGIADQVIEGNVLRTWCIKCQYIDEIEIKKKVQEAGWRALSADQRETPTVAMMQFARANADMKRSSFRGMLASVSIPEDPVIACALKLNRTESCTIDCIEATFLDVLLKG